ncbi:hypothetical protein ABTN11_20120, partial [Acinetobacter baumannii]
MRHLSCEQQGMVGDGGLGQRLRRTPPRKSYRPDRIRNRQSRLAPNGGSSCDLFPGSCLRVS